MMRIGDEHTRATRTHQHLSAFIWIKIESNVLPLQSSRNSCRFTLTASWSFLLLLLYIAHYSHANQVKLAAVPSAASPHWRCQNHRRSGGGPTVSDSAAPSLLGCHCMLLTGIPISIPMIKTSQSQRVLAADRTMDSKAIDLCPQFGERCWMLMCCEIESDGCTAWY